MCLHQDRNCGCRFFYYLERERERVKTVRHTCVHTYYLYERETLTTGVQYRTNRTNDERSRQAGGINRNSVVPCRTVPRDSVSHTHNLDRRQGRFLALRAGTRIGRPLSTNRVAITLCRLLGATRKPNRASSLSLFLQRVELSRLVSARESDKND